MDYRRLCGRDSANHAGRNMATMPTERRDFPFGRGCLAISDRPRLVGKRQKVVKACHRASPSTKRPPSGKGLTARPIKPISPRCQSAWQLALAEARLIDAENLFRQPGPPQIWHWANDERVRLLAPHERFSPSSPGILVLVLFPLEKLLKQHLCFPIIYYRVPLPTSSIGGRLQRLCPFWFFCRRTPSLRELLFLADAFGRRVCLFPARLV